jgi:hypothetical protein
MYCCSSRRLRMMPDPGHFGPWVAGTNTPPPLTSLPPLPPPAATRPSPHTPCAQTPENAKALLARGVAQLPESTKLWMAAAKLETDDAAKARVLRKVGGGREGGGRQRLR